MKAIILSAGIGSRIRPLTDNTHKSLLSVGGKPILDRMIHGLLGQGIKEIVMVTGYREEDLKSYVTTHFPQLPIRFVRNERYLETNTGYSLLLTRPFVEGDSFIKCDGDVVFEGALIEKLITSSHSSCLCMDKNIDLAAEEVKVKLDTAGKIIQVGKTVSPQEAAGESIGIEKLSAEAGTHLFNTLDALMKDPQHHQDYYDDSYTTLVNDGIPFYAVDITGLKWVEIDTHQDYELAQKLFIE